MEAVIGVLFNITAQQGIRGNNNIDPTLISYRSNTFRFAAVGNHRHNVGCEFLQLIAPVIDQ
ncbi:hypothetical protein D3C73_1360450 [compost metagenome]